MINFWLMVVILTMLIIGISLLLKKKGTVMYVVPLIFTLIGVLVLILSFIIGRWTGFGLAFISFAVFLSSAISFIAIGIIDYTQRK
jgi:YesK-like protein